MTTTTRAALAILLDLILPATCAGCAQPGPPLCQTCTTTLSAPFRVSRPGLAHGPPVYALAAYEGPARAAVIAYKGKHRRDLTRPLSRPLAAALPCLPGATPDKTGTWWLIPAPSRKSESRRRGGCHLTRLARATAAALSATGRPTALAPALHVTGRTRDSVGLSAAARTANLNGRIKVTGRGAPPSGTPVTLLDDVIASGATATTCIRALKEADIRVTTVLTLTAV